MLQVHQFPCLSDNYGYLLHDPQSYETVCIDTPDADAYLREADARGWPITAIWNTHWHPDHAGGNAAMRYVISGPNGVTITCHNCRDYDTGQVIDGLLNRSTP